MKFPYLNNEPVVPVEIRTSSGDWEQFFGYLDSGAGYSVFHPDVAEILKVDIPKGRKIYLTVGDGSKIEAYIHKLKVNFAGFEFAAEITFSEKLGVETNIIGIKSFFDRFKVCFNNKIKQVELTLFQ